MSYDLVIRGGLVVDGSGLPAERADVGVSGDRIATVGRISSRGREEIDANGQVVTPGFIDGHTHMDAQVMWDPMGTSSCWHGVTSVAMGNCGFTLAPARPHARHLVLRNLERAEDISREAMAAGITWTWERFEEYLDAVERTPKGINYAASIGHSALRTWAMGERAFEEEADEDDLVTMVEELRRAMDAGAVGFTTSRSANHETADDRPVASRVASWGELSALVHVVGEYASRVFELAPERAWYSEDDVERQECFARTHALAVGASVPITFGVLAQRGEDYRRVLGFVDSAVASGARVYGQANPREFATLLSFRTRLPFDHLPEWEPIRSQPIEVQRRAFSDPVVRGRLVDAARIGRYGRSIGAEVRAPDYSSLRVLHDPVGPNPSVAELAAARGVDPVELMIEIGAHSDFDQFFVQVNGNRDLAQVQEILEHPRTLVTFSDSGAHVSQIVDASIHTHLLAYWVRDRQVLTLEQAVRLLTLAPARVWGFHERGLLREGLIADLNVFDPDRIRPRLPTVAHDLPGGAMRLIQRSDGIAATIVSGQVVLRDGEHTGALPGKLVRAKA